MHIDIGDDTIGCFGFVKSFSLNVKNATYLWQNGATSSSINASDSGLYFVEVTVSGCVYHDSARIFLFPTPYVDLGNDTSICFQNGSLILDAKNGGSTYLWNNSSINQTLAVTKEGVYSVVVTNIHGCTETDDIVLIETCPARVYAPNAFSPDGDGINDCENDGSCDHTIDYTKPKTVN